MVQKDKKPVFVAAPVRHADKRQGVAGKDKTIAKLSDTDILEKRFHEKMIYTQRYFKFLVVIFAIAIMVPQIALAAWWNPFSWGVWNRVFHFKQTEQNQVVCTMDAKLCPDGSYVGRHGVKCEFDACPDSSANEESMLSDVYPLPVGVAGIAKNAQWGQPGPSPMQRLPGNETTVIGEIKDNSGTGEFFGYYEKKLKPLGWSVDGSFTADGITGSQVGYKKDNNYIVLSYGITPGKITSGANEPLQWTCPCKVTYKVFTSSTLMDLSEESIVGAIGQLEKVQFVKNNGFYNYKNIKQGWGVDITGMVRGDINGDGLTDAFVRMTFCGASCGSEFSVVLGGQQGMAQALKVTPENFIASGAGQYAVKNMEIKNKTIYILAETPDYQGRIKTETFKYNFDGKNLIKIK